MCSRADSTAARDRLDVAVDALIGICRDARCDRLLAAGEPLRALYNSVLGEGVKPEELALLDRLARENPEGRA
jgi:hypothetical protein